MQYKGDGFNIMFCITITNHLILGLSEERDLTVHVNVSFVFCSGCGERDPTDVVMVAPEIHM